MIAEDKMEIITYWGKSCFGENSTPPWELKWVPNRGYIAISTRSFNAGDLICYEYPTTWTKAWHPFTQSEKDKIEEEIQISAIQLTEEKDAFFAMSNSFPDIKPISAGIYMTNSFDLPYCTELGEENSSSNELVHRASGMFLAIGRLNHSCTPNTQQTFIPSVHQNNSGTNKLVGFEVLYATRTIAVGEELNDCYIELRQTTEARRTELMDLYCFHCTCAACGNDSDDIIHNNANRVEDDARRKRALKLDSDMLEFVNMGELEMAIDLGIELIKLLESGKSIGWGERYIAEACVSTSQIMLEIGGSKQRRQAVELIEKAHEWNIKLQGKDSIDSKNTEAKLRKLRISSQKQ